MRITRLAPAGRGQTLPALVHRPVAESRPMAFLYQTDTAGEPPAQRLDSVGSGRRELRRSTADPLLQWRCNHSTMADTSAQALSTRAEPSGHLANWQNRSAMLPAAREPA